MSRCISIELNVSFCSLKSHNSHQSIINITKSNSLRILTLEPIALILIFKLFSFKKERTKAIITK